MTFQVSFFEDIFATFVSLWCHLVFPSERYSSILVFVFSSLLENFKEYFFFLISVTFYSDSNTYLGISCDDITLADCLCPFVASYFEHELAERIRVTCVLQMSTYFISHRL